MSGGRSRGRWGWWPLYSAEHCLGVSWSLCCQTCVNGRVERDLCGWLLLFVETFQLFQNKVLIIVTGAASWTVRDCKMQPVNTCSEVWRHPAGECALFIFCTIFHLPWSFPSLFWSGNCGRRMCICVCVRISTQVQV